MPRPPFPNSCNRPRTEAGLRSADRQRSKLVRRRPWPFLVLRPVRAHHGHPVGWSGASKADVLAHSPQSNDGWNAEGPFLGGDALKPAIRFVAGVDQNQIGRFLHTWRKAVIHSVGPSGAGEIPGLCGAGVRKVLQPEDKPAGQNEQEPSRLTRRCRGRGRPTFPAGMGDND